MGSHSPRHWSGVHLAKELFVELLASSHPPTQVANHLGVPCFSSHGPCQIGRHSPSLSIMLRHVQMVLNCTRVQKCSRLSVACLLCSISSLAPQVSAQEQSMGRFSAPHTCFCSQNLLLMFHPPVLESLSFLIPS